MCDIQSVIKLSKNIGSHGRNKHIAIIHHFIREKVGEKEIKISH
jgi:hypothetical protein